MISFSGKILKLGINPYLGLPVRVLSELFRQSGRSKGPIPVRGKLDGKKFKQTVVRYQGAWRLYLNTPMRRDAGIDVGDNASLEIEFDPAPRPVPMHPNLGRALTKNKAAKSAFEKLVPSRQKEILRYLNSLKSGESVRRNVENVIRLLSGKKSTRLSFFVRR